MEKLKTESLSTIAVVLLLILVSVLGSLAIYFVHYDLLGEVQKEGAQIIKGFIKVEAVEPGIGYIKLYIRSIDFEGRVDVVYFLDPHDYTLLAFARLPQPVEISVGELVEVTVPLVLVEYLSADAAQALGVKVDDYLHFQSLQEALGKPVIIGVGSYSWNRIAILAISTEPVNLAPYLRKAAKALIGFMAERDWEEGGPLDMNPNKTHYIRVNLVTGEYEFIYIDDQGVRRASGRAKVLKDTNVLDLSKLDWNERYKLGPIVVFINPHFAAKDYEVKIITIGEHLVKISMEKLVDDKRLVGLDALVCWEDLWWPNTGASLDDYQDHVVRITVFTNDTIRIESLQAKGGYLHVFFINPPPVDKEKLQSLVNQYMANNHTLPLEAGVVYVKAHGVKIPPLDPYDLWDPVEGKWIRRWPLVFYR